ncbi:MAG: 1,4-dihydroxy-2-naphthoate octaprenyltransferase, partial [Chloroflexota bacterium]
LASPRAVARAAALSLALAALAGVALAAVGGWPIVGIGLAAVAAAVGYTGGPLRYGYRGLGDVAVFAFFGPVAVAGTAYLHLGHVPPAALAASLPVACLVTAILVVNNLRDLETDRVAGKRTLAVLFGPRAARGEFVGLVGGAYASLALAVALGALPLGASLALVTAPLALPLLRAVRPGAPAAAMNAALRATARLHLAFGLLLGAGLLFFGPPR